MPMKSTAWVEEKTPIRTQAGGTRTATRIPSLDGLRAISIMMVIGAHATMGMPALDSHPFLSYTFLSGDRGVSVFFVISGFLITSLLLKEEQETGRISLRHFYIRRAFRILPPFWVFLITVGVLWKIGALQCSWRILGTAFIFLRDYTNGDWWTGHTWSLSIEEQFYIFWPTALLFLGKRRSFKIALALIACAPAIRIFSQIWMEQFGYRQIFMLHMRIDSLMCGCALAMAYGNPKFAQIVERTLKWPVMVAVLFFFFFVSGYLTHRFRGYYLLPFGFTLESIAITYLLLYFIKKPSSLGGRILNSKVLVHIGLISYSLYLWQELFLPPQVAHAWAASTLEIFPVNLLALLLTAELSWYLVERQALKVRRKFENTKASTAESDIVHKQRALILD